MLLHRCNTIIHFDYATWQLIAVMSMDVATKCAIIARSYPNIVVRAFEMDQAQGSNSQMTEVSRRHHAKELAAQSKSKSTPTSKRNGWSVLRNAARTPRNDAM